MERLPLAEPIVALQEAREGHLRAIMCVGLESHGVFGVLLVGDGEDQRLFVIDLFLDPPFGDCEVLEVGFKHLLSGIRRKARPSGKRQPRVARSSARVNKSCRMPTVSR